MASHSHVLVYHGPLLSHLLGVASHLLSLRCMLNFGRVLKRNRLGIQQFSQKMPIQLHHRPGPPFFIARANHEPWNEQQKPLILEAFSKGMFFSKPSIFKGYVCFKECTPWRFKINILHFCTLANGVLVQMIFLLQLLVIFRFNIHFQGPMKPTKRMWTYSISTGSPSRRISEVSNIVDRRNPAPVDIMVNIHSWSTYPKITYTPFQK